jgi:HEAT repeat protein
VWEDCLVGYLRERKDAAQAPSIAGLIIEQLRERNFILCALGGDNYAFIHRTFLEYFCAAEIVERFGKRGTEGGLTFEQLRDDVFGAHWQDESWHEVLRLICGEIAPKFAGELIEFLMGREVDRSEFLIHNQFLKKEGLLNLFLAADCLEEVRDRAEILSISQQLLNQLQQEAEVEDLRPLWDDAAHDLLQRIAMIWGEAVSVKQWLLGCLKFKAEPISFVPSSTVKAIAQIYKDNSETLIWIKDRIQKDGSGDVRRAAVEAIAQGWKEDPETLPMLKNCVQHDDLGQVRSAAVKAIAEGWKDDPETLPMLKNRVQQDDNGFVRSAAVEVIAQGWKDDPETFLMLKDRIQQDSNEFVLSAVVRALVEGWKENPDILPILKDLIQQAVNPNVRSTAVKAIARGWKDDPDTLPILKDRVQNDDNGDVRSAAVWVIAQGWKDDPDTLPWLKDRVQQDDNGDVRSAALRAIVKDWKDNPDVIQLLFQVAIRDPFERKAKWQDNPRKTALEKLLRQAHTDPQIIELLRDRSENDNDEQLREWAKTQLKGIGD